MNLSEKVEELRGLGKSWEEIEVELDIKFYPDHVPLVDHLPAGVWDVDRNADDWFKSLSNRTKNCLKSAGVSTEKTIRSRLATDGSAWIKSIYGLGKSSLSELEKSLNIDLSPAKQDCLSPEAQKAKADRITKAIKLLSDNGITVERRIKTAS